MYMTKLCFSPAVLAGQGLYDAHRALWQVFGRGPDQPRDFLYRQMNTFDFLVVSAAPPQDCSLLQANTVKDYDPKLAAGDRLLVSLRANPVCKRRDANGRQMRVDVIQDQRKRLLDQGTPESELPSRLELAESEGLRWLTGRQERLGLEFDATTFMAESYAREEFQKSGGRTVVLSRLDLRVFARVTDPGRLRTALFQGVGCAKGFGFGLLLIRRV